MAPVIVSNTYLQKMQFSLIFLFLKNFARQYHITKTIRKKGSFAITAPYAYHAGFHYGYNVVPMATHGDSLWYNYVWSVAKIPTTSRMPVQVGLPSEFTVWIEFKKSLNFAVSTNMFALYITGIQVIRRAMLNIPVWEIVRVANTSVRRPAQDAAILPTNMLHVSHVPWKRYPNYWQSWNSF